MADPGFPVGGVDFWGGYISKILYVETKEFGLLGGGVRRAPLDPPMIRLLEIVSAIRPYKKPIR